MGHKLAHTLVNLLRLLATEKGSYEYYKLTFLMEDIRDESNRYHMSKLLNRTW